jgi:outer membrane protein assembly factor BamD (BamD/ComL family)
VVKTLKFPQRYANSPKADEKQGNANQSHSEPPNTTKVMAALKDFNNKYPKHHETRHFQRVTRCYSNFTSIKVPN